MTGSLLERLRPVVVEPDPTWSDRTLASILNASTDLQPHSTATTPDLVVVRGGSERPRARVSRRITLVVAAAVVLVVGVGIGVHHSLSAESPTLVAGPAPAQTGTAPVMTDLGPLSAGERRSLVKACTDPANPSPVANVLYSRRTSSGSGETPRQAVVVEDYRSEYRLCVNPAITPGTSNTVAGFGPGVLVSGGDLSPTSQRPLSVIATYQLRYERRGARFVNVHLAVAYAVTPKVARVEVRLSGAGADGRWFLGTVQGGFAYIPLFVPELEAPNDTPRVSLDARGFSASGQLVGSDHQPCLNGNRDSRGDERSFWR